MASNVDLGLNSGNRRTQMKIEVKGSKTRREDTHRNISMEGGEGKGEQKDNRGGEKTRGKV